MNFYVDGVSRVSDGGGRPLPRTSVEARAAGGASSSSAARQSGAGGREGSGGRCGAKQRRGREGRAKDGRRVLRRLVDVSSAGRVPLPCLLSPSPGAGSLYLS